MFRISNHYVSKIVFVLLFVEMLVLLGAAYLGISVRFIDLGHPAGAAGVSHMDHYFTSAVAFTAAIIFSMSAMGHVSAGFQRGLEQSLLHEADALVRDGLLDPDLGVLRGAGLVFRPRRAGARVRHRRGRHLHGAHDLLQRRRNCVSWRRASLFLGSGPLAKECSDLAKQSGSYHRYHITGFIGTPTEEMCVPPGNLLKAREGDKLDRRGRASTTSRKSWVSVQNRRGGFPIKELLECKLQGMKVTDAATFFERETCQIRVDSLQPSWLVFGGGFDQSFVRTFMKRSFDIVCSLIILVLTFPIMLLASLAVWMEDRGPVFYSQERVGLDGHTFRVHKFRSMRTDAEKGGKPQWAQQNDPRITRVGNFMRKTRIDELPQVLNVIMGEMSFVGPRPERPYFVEQLIEVVPYYNVRHSVKPGITGWAQVRYGYGASAEDALQKLQYDLYYVKNNSLFLDVLVLIDTLKVVLFRSGR